MGQITAKHGTNYGKTWDKPRLRQNMGQITAKHGTNEPRKSEKCKQISKNAKNLRNRPKNLKNRPTNSKIAQKTQKSQKVEIAKLPENGLQHGKTWDISMDKHGENMDKHGTSMDKHGTSTFHDFFKEKNRTSTAKHGTKKMNKFCLNL